MEVISNFATLTLVEIAENQPEPAQFTPTPEQNPVTYRPSANDPPWKSPVAIGVWIASVVFIVLLPSFFLLPYIATLDLPQMETKALIEFAQTDKTAVFLQVLSIIPAHVLTLLLAWLVVTRGRQYSFRQTLGWENGGIRWWHYLTILLAFLLVAGAVSQIAPEQDNDLLKILRSSLATKYIIVIMATFTAPIVEEVVYRGVLFSAFQRSVGVPAAFAIVTFMFAFVHVPQYYPSYSTIFLLTLLSVSLTALRVVSKNLYPCIVLHMLFNGLQSIMILLDNDAVAPVGPDPVAAILGLI